MPKLEMHIQSWAPLTITDQNRLESLQRRAIRIILNLPYTSPICDIQYSITSILPLKHRRNFASTCYAFKLINGLLPMKQNKYVPDILHHPYPTRNNNLLIPGLSSITSRYIDRSPLVLCVKLTNCIPSHLRYTNSIIDFKITI